MNDVVVPLVDLGTQHRNLRQQLVSAFGRVLDSGRYVLGPAVREFEDALSPLVGGGGVVGVSSGSDALVCALMALGVGKGDEVVTTPFSFVSTATAIARLGAIPVFADIDPRTYTLEPQSVAAARTARTKAVVVVHLYGHPANMSKLRQVVDGVPLVEDAAQALGARWLGRPVGSFGAFGCFSFFPAKPLGALGDGGAISCGSKGATQVCRQLRSHGATEKYRHEILGGNFRLDELQAAFLSVKLGYLEQWNEERRRIARFYMDALKGLDGIELPWAHPDALPVYSQFTLRVTEGRREALAAALAGRGIETAIHYPKPLYCQPCLAQFGAHSQAFPQTERAAAEVISLPIYPELSEAQASHVVHEVKRFLCQ